MRALINGVGLHVATAGQGRPLLLLHGFMGSTATWAPFVPALAQRWRVIAVDLLGHGGSDAPPEAERYTMERCVQDLLALLDHLEARRPVVLGYSLGGRVALGLAAAAPDRLAGLALESASPGLLTPEERLARTRGDEALVDDLRRDGLPAFVERWQRLPLFDSQTALPQATRTTLRAQRLANNPVGLAGSLCGLGTGRQAPLWDRLPGLDLPVLVVAGDLDTKFAALAQRMAADLPRARLALAPSAGHAVHLERPTWFLATIEAFLNEIAGAGPLGQPALKVEGERA